MNILYFFTYGYSLKTWNESGQLNRELKHFEKLHEENNKIKFTLITYGIKDDLNLLDRDFIDIIPIYQYSKKSKYKIFDLINSLFLFKKINRAIENKPTLVIQNQLLGCWVSFIFKRKFKIPLVIRTGYDMYEFSIKEKKKYFKRILYKYLTLFGLLNSDMYTVTSKCDLEFLRLNFNEKYIKKIKIRKNWVDFEDVSYGLDKSYELNKLVSVGRLESQKNYPLIFKALEGTDFELDIFGEGSLKEELNLLSKDLNIKVNFMGILNNEKLLLELRKYQYYLTASTYEGNPKSVLEAMLSGCVVIASNVKNHKEFLDSSNSFLFENDNLEDLKNTLNKIKNKPDIKEIQKKSKSTLKKEYSLQNLVKLELKDFYELVC
jgi:glycosyltransferase involved in cell wall biosynthesis